MQVVFEERDPEDVSPPPPPASDTPEDSPGRSGGGNNGVGNGGTPGGGGPSRVIVNGEVRTWRPASHAASSESSVPPCS